ncbi:2360_t:CDS:2, partial [Cetraspora pellucida]
HLALYCKGSVPDDIKRKWLIEVAKRGEKVNNKDKEIYNRKKVKRSDQLITSHFQSINKLSSQQFTDITKALLKAFVYCEILFAIIDNLYFQDFLNLLQSSYTPPHKDALLGSILDREIAQIVVNYTATLADCFIEIVQIAIALKKIPISNNFYALAIAVFNARYELFDISLYLLTYFLYPNYRNNSLKRKFYDICELAVSYYKDMHHSEKECCELVSQLINYKAKVMPWDIEFSFNLMPATW